MTNPRRSMGPGGIELTTRETAVRQNSNWATPPGKNDKVNDINGKII